MTNLPSLSRRDCLSLFGTAAAGVLAVPAFGLESSLHPSSGDASLFSFPPGTVYLNAARLHPLSSRSIAALHAYLEVRRLNPVPEATYFTGLETRVKASFSRLINAAPEDVSFTASAQVTENLVVNGLGLEPGKGSIVTDALHYRGCIYLYTQMAQRGYDVRIVPARDGRIAMEDMAKAIDEGTKLVSLSLVSYMNGFEHDLKAVCELAHAKGALVYADIVQAVGAVPVDVKASGVDFCGATAHKWLMGDHGLGFLYVKPGLLDTRLKRTQFGTDQLTGYTDHVFAADPPLGKPASWTVLGDAGGHFEVGTKPSLVVASLVDSLDFLNTTGVATIQEKRRPLLQMLREELPKAGYPCVTPVGSDTSILSFAAPDKEKADAKLKAKGVTVSFIEHTMRVSPSVYNTLADGEALVGALRG